MKETIYYRHRTSDFPMAVYYFSPSQIMESTQVLRRRNGLFILHMHAGQVEFHTDSDCSLLGAGDICILTHRTPFSLHTVSMDTRYIIMHFSLELLDFPPGHFFHEKFIVPLREGSMELPTLIHPGDPCHEELAQQLSRLDPEKEGTDAYTAQLLAIAMNLCAILLPMGSPTKEPEPTQYSPEQVKQRCLDYMNNNFHSKVTLQELADYVHLHPNYLCALFKEQTGNTLFQELNYIRLRYAIKLLRTTDLPIQTVCEQSGFQNASFFARKFRQYVGCSPSKYRASQSPAGNNPQEAL